MAEDLRKMRGCLSLKMPACHCAPRLVRGVFMSNTSAHGTLKTRGPLRRKGYRPTYDLAVGSKKMERAQEHFDVVTSFLVLCIDGLADRKMAIQDEKPKKRSDV